MNDLCQINGEGLVWGEGGMVREKGYGIIQSQISSRQSKLKDDRKVRAQPKEGRLGSANLYSYRSFSLKSAVGDKSSALLL